MKGVQELSYGKKTRRYDPIGGGCLRGLRCLPLFPFLIVAKASTGFTFNPVHHPADIP